jgi:type I restriction enzyme S subunit
MREIKLRDLLHSWDAGAWGEPARNDRGVSVLRSTNFREGGRLSFENQAVLAIDDTTLENKRLTAGDILLERSGGGPLQPVGRVAGFWGSDAHDKFICGNFISRLVPNRDLVDSLYLMYALLNLHVSGKTENLQTATTGIRNLQMKQYLDNKLLLPIDVRQQRVIAARLKAQLAEVETARRAAHVQAREMQALKSNVLRSIFSDIEDWRPIGSIAKLQSGYAFKSDTFKTSGVRLLRNANILPGKIYWDDSVFLSEDDAKGYPAYVLKQGDVLISLDRPIISSGFKVARVDQDDLPALLVQRVGRFLLDKEKLDADYLFAFLQSESFISKVSGHDQSLGVPHISPSQVEAVEIPLPDIIEQRRLAKQLNDVSSAGTKATIAVQSQLNDLSALPQRLLAQAFES